MSNSYLLDKHQYKQTMLMQHLLNTFCFLLICLYTSSLQAQTTPEQLIVAIQDYGRPLGYIDDKTKQITGYSYDIIEEIRRLSGLKFTYVFVKNYDELLQLFLQGKAHLTPSIAVSEERKKHFIFSRPYETTSLLLFVKASDETTKGLKPKMKVAAVRASASVRYLTAHKDIEVIQYATYQDAHRALLNNEIDAYTASSARVEGLLKETNTAGSVKPVGEPIGVINRAIAISKDKAELLEIINDAISKLLQSPTYNEIRKKWYPKELQ